MYETIYFNVSDDGVFPIMSNKHIKRDKIVVYIKYRDSYEMLMSVADTVLTVEVYDNEIRKSEIENVSIEEIIVNVLTEIESAEICSKEEFMSAYNNLAGNIKNIVGY